MVRTLASTAAALAAAGCLVEVVGPERFRTMPCPTYPAIRLAVAPGRRLADIVQHFAPEALHIATEGPLGMAARSLALRQGRGFTTAFHTRFPEYLHARTRIPLALSYSWLRRFHGAGAGMMVATASLRAELAGRGFQGVLPWSRGVDLGQFHPAAAAHAEPAWDLPRPIFAYVGRIAVEKNIEAFLALDLPGSKLVVGDGPALPKLRASFPGVHFAGARHGQALAAAYATADAFVFPSRTDTFGLAMLESLACGTPVAAFPVTGPADLLAPGLGIGVVNADLRQAALAALAERDRDACRRYAETYSWTACATQFRANLHPIQ